ncbi:High-affinity methionine permease [Colletotrichum sp. SAR11_240]|nr:High-affinity methionine permease [Colletotrichum sp. SAR11_240]
MAPEGDVIKSTPAISTASDGADDSVKDGQLGVVEVNVLQERTIGLFGAVSLVVNKIIGAGIFSTPSTIFKLSGSVGMALMCWVIGAIISTCGIFVMLEFGTAIPRSGGIKNYLERAFSPRLMQTCIYVFYCVFLRTSSSGYNIGSAILNVIFSFQGYDNVNAVLSEVRNPQRTLRLALPLSMGVIAVLYLLANVAYFAAVPKEAFIAAKVTVAATLFENVFGPSAGAKALPALVALSALGHLLGVAFTIRIARLLQELAKDGVLPFSNLFMENRPFRTPIYALLLHLGVTILFICAPPAGDAFNFVVSLSSYPTTVLLFAITVGLVKLRLTDRANFHSPLPAPWILIVIYLAANIFLIVMPFVRPPNGKGSTSLPYWLSSVVALGILSLGIIYYTLRFVVVPRLLGYKHQEIQQELSDGSKVTRFQRIKR